MTLRDLAAAHQETLDRVAGSASRSAASLWRERVDPAWLDQSWDQLSPELETVVGAAQVLAAKHATSYVDQAGRLQGVTVTAGVVPQAFAGVTREGREIIPELFTAVTTTKALIGGGADARFALRAGVGVLSVLTGTAVADAGKSADRTLAVGKRMLYSVRVVQPGACSRCAILAGVIGYRDDFQRHPRCRCTSMPLSQGDSPDGFFRDPSDYFESLPKAEQDRVFTKTGAEAIRLGANPAKVVDARRGMYRSSVRRSDGSYAPARLRPVTIGRKADGSPLQVYATTEGNTARGAWGRTQALNVRLGNERYRRTSTLRLMPEQIIHMAPNPDRAVELLRRYGYLT